MSLTGTILSNPLVRYTAAGETITEFRLLMHTGQEIPVCSFGGIAEELEFCISPKTNIVLTGDFEDNNHYSLGKRFLVHDFTILSQEHSASPPPCKATTQQIYIDTREKKTSHITPIFTQNGIPFAKSCLYYGDYYNPQFQVIIERKNSPEEIVGNLTDPQKATSLSLEFRRGLAAGLRWILLIETPIQQNLTDYATWTSTNPNLSSNNPLKNHPGMFYNILNTWARKYNMEIWCCAKDQMGYAISYYIYKKIPMKKVSYQ